MTPAVRTSVKALTTHAAAHTVRLPGKRVTARLGDVVVAALDEAARLTSDPRRAAELAAEAVACLLAQAGRTGLALRLAAGTAATALA